MFLLCAMIHQRKSTLSMSGSTCSHVNKFWNSSYACRSGEKHNEKWSETFLYKWLSIHLASITRFERTAAIEPLMHSASFSFNLLDGRQKGQAQSVHGLVLRWHDRCYWTAKSLTHPHSGSRLKALLNKKLDKLNSFQNLLAESQQHHELLHTIPNFDLLRFQRFLFSDIEKDARCHTPVTPPGFRTATFFSRFSFASRAMERLYSYTGFL